MKKISFWFYPPGKSSSPHLMTFILRIKFAQHDAIGSITSTPSPHTPLSGWDAGLSLPSPPQAFSSPEPMYTLEWREALSQLCVLPSR